MIREKIKAPFASDNDGGSAENKKESQIPVRKQK